MCDISTDGAEGRLAKLVLTELKARAINPAVQGLQVYLVEADRGLIRVRQVVLHVAERCRGEAVLPSWQGASVRQAAKRALEQVVDAVSRFLGMRERPLDRADGTARVHRSFHVGNIAAGCRPSQRGAENVCQGRLRHQERHASVQVILKRLRAPSEIDFRI